MTLAEAGLLALSAPAAGATLYLVLLTLFSRRVRPPAHAAPRLRFDVVVPAHDEAAGIAATVGSLLAVDYPRALYRVTVVADNCADDTAGRARAAGARVLVRDDPSLRGKGHALAHAFARILDEGRADAVAVVDADTVVSPDLLHAFAARLEAGAPAVQADYGVQNPRASWRTLLLAMALGSVHTLRSRARECLGLSAGLHGNGMCFAARTLRAVPHDAFSLVEDLEYGLRLGEAGQRVHYAGEARVLGEMPSGERAGRTQRRRWEEGRSRMARDHALPLLVRAIRARDAIALDLAIDLLIPPLATVVAATALGLAASLFLSWASGRLVLAAWSWIGCAVGLSLYVVRGWHLSGAGAAGLLALIHAPRFIAWKLLLALRRPAGSGGEWVRTPREGEEAP